MVLQQPNTWAGTDGMLNISLVEVDPEARDAISAELALIAAALRPFMDEQALDALREQVAKLATQFPLYPKLAEVVR